MCLSSLSCSKRTWLASAALLVGCVCPVMSCILSWCQMPVRPGHMAPEAVVHVSGVPVYLIGHF